MPPPSPEKNEFLPENGVFWCILGLKLVRPMGGAPPAPWIRHCMMMMMMSADGDDQEDQQHELADPSMAGRRRAAVIDRS